MAKAVPKARLIDIQQAGIPRTAQGVPIRPRQTWNIQSDVARQLRRQEDTESQIIGEQGYDPSLAPTLSDRLYGFGDQEPNQFNNNHPIYGRMRMRHLREAEAASGYRRKLNAGANPGQENPTGIEFNNFLDTLPEGDRHPQGSVHGVSARRHSYLRQEPILHCAPPMSHHAPVRHPAMSPMFSPSQVNPAPYVPRMSTPGAYPYSSCGSGMEPAYPNLASTPFQSFNPQLVMQAQQAWNSATPEEHSKFLHHYYGGQTVPMTTTNPSPVSYLSMPYQMTSPHYAYSSPRYSSPTIPMWYAQSQHAYSAPMQSPISLPPGLSEYRDHIRRSACESVLSNGSSLKYRTIAIPRCRRYPTGLSESSRHEYATAHGQNGRYEDDEDVALPAKRKRWR